MLHLRHSVSPVIYGMHDGFGNYYFQAECQTCYLRNCGGTASHATFNHLVHCARKHSYVFEEDYPIYITPQDEMLQQAITLSMVHGFPAIPGYETHKNCLLQVREGKTVCILHDMEGTWAVKGTVRYL